MEEPGVISVITRRSANWPHLTQVVAISGGPYTEVRGSRNERPLITLGVGEWTVAYLFVIPVLRITNLGNGLYCVSRPFPGIFGNGFDLKDVINPTKVDGTIAEM